MKNILLYILFISTSVHSQKDASLVEIFTYAISSEILETKRDYWVCLPSNYDSTISYPVIYVLDAKWRFGITNALEKELSSNGKIPAHIVVGITHDNRRFDMSFSTSRVNHKGETDTIAFNSQNSGNGLKFLEFIEEELIEEINLRYSTSGFNILIGHSLGGYFCSYILPIKKSFKSLQMYDPSLWFSGGEAIHYIDSNLSKKSESIVFISSSGNYENQFAYFHEKIEELKQTLNGFPNIHYEYKNYEEEHHNSMYLHSFLDGMSMLYGDYELKMGGWETRLNVSNIEEHYKQFSKSIEFEFVPPVDLYLKVGWMNYYQKKYLNCIESLKIYLDNNSTDVYALELIGDAYFVLGKEKQSLKYYSRAYELSTDNIELMEKINKFKD